MTKKIILGLVFSLTLVMVGCTSNDAKKEDGATASADASTGDAAAADAAPKENLDAEQDLANAKGGSADLDKDVSAATDDKVSADLGDELDKDTTANSAPDQKPSDGLPDDTLGASTDQKTATNDTPPPPTPESVSADKAADMPPADSTVAPPGADTMTPPVDAAPRPVASLKKIKDAPFKKHGALLNAVYVARKGDTLKSVSQKIYGTPSRVKDLKVWNPYLKKKLKSGDKIYYNSPQRPTDDTKMATWYEDMGIAPQTYTAKDGDDLKAVGKQLLNDRDAWKELYATNPNLDSKGALIAGTEIRYWPAMDQTAAATEQATPGLDQPTAGTPPPPVPEAPSNLAAPSGPSAPGGPGQAIAGNPPPPPMPAQPAVPPSPPPAAGSLEATPPPPPPPAENAPPKPRMRPPPVAKDSGTDPDVLMGLGAGAVIVVALVLLVIIRKNRAKRMDFGQTQV